MVDDATFPLVQTSVHLQLCISKINELKISINKALGYNL